MKQTIYLLASLFLMSCVPSDSKQKDTSNSDTLTANNIRRIHQKSAPEQYRKEEKRHQYLSGFEKASLFKLTDTINADFNGDGFSDNAIYKKEQATSGIIIIHGKTNNLVKIGFGKEFANMTEFNWVDYWGLVEDNETSETTFTEDGDVLDSKTIKLECVSIALGRNEVGGGLITFRNGKYEWIQQTS